MIFVARLVVVVSGVIGVLSETPGFIVALELYAFVDGKGRNANARKAEVIGAVIMSGFRVCVGTNLETEILRCRLHSRVECGSLSARDFNFFGCAERPDIVEIKI